MSYPIISTPLRLVLVARKIAIPVVMMATALCARAGSGASISASGGKQSVRPGDLAVRANESITVTDLGTTLELGGAVTISGGSVDVSSGGLLRTSTAHNESTRLADSNARGSVTGRGSTWTIQGGFEIGDFGEAHLSILDGGFVASGLNGERSRVSGAGDETVGPSTATVTGRDSRWLAFGILQVGDSGEAHVTIADGGSVISGLNGEPSGISGRSDPGKQASSVTVTGRGSSWNIGSSLAIGDFGDAHLFVLDGGIVEVGNGDGSRINGGNDEIASARVDGKGSLWRLGGDLFVASDAKMEIAHEGIVSVAGKVAAEASSLIDINDSTLNVGTLQTQGVLRGTGLVNGPVESNGVIDIGHSIGRLTIASLDQQPQGVVNLELGGRDGPGVGFDQLVIEGTASFEGTTNVTLIDGFVPNAGDVFSVITYKSRSGSVPSAHGRLGLPDLGASLHWVAEYRRDELRLSVEAVPEPSTFLLAALAGVGLLAIRSRGLRSR